MFNRSARSAHDIVALSINSNVEESANEVADPAQVMDEF